MRKKILVLFLLFLLVGCKKINNNNDNYIELVQNCLNDKKVTNNVSSGYKYYVPKGVKKIKDFDNNQIFLIDGDRVYLYVDVISYFYNKEIRLEDSKDSFYYHEINNNDKTGYIKILKVKDDKYYVSIIYNYSKIEFYTTYEKLNKMVTLTSIIINNIDYNDVIIEKVLEGDLGQFSEFTYEVEKPEDANSNFSQYLEEYVQKESTEQLPDE